MQSTIKLVFKRRLLRGRRNLPASHLAPAVGLGARSCARGGAVRSLDPELTPGSRARLSARAACCGTRSGGREGRAAATRPGRSRPRPPPAQLPPSSRPPQAPPARAARSFSDSCQGAQFAAPRPAPSVPSGRHPPSPRHDHPANSPAGPGTLGLPPRGGQGLRTASRHFPGKRIPGRAGSGAIPGWGVACPGGDLRRPEPRGRDRRRWLPEPRTELGSPGASRCARCAERFPHVSGPPPLPHAQLAGEPGAAEHPLTASAGQRGPVFVVSP